ncbi:hypothetical protein B0F90DRAFT_1752810 [Multifurca ochricompacta]|uniref:Uncharacterized protein n=1 Tax=Multifurca ochricompacta TaxID=376703 RepID=A0AAD4LZ61_9AGAM|nr:hypothetical protein B0F90DRAFT_1752810 [Multifurca ochricompacta]
MKDTRLSSSSQSEQIKATSFFLQRTRHSHDYLDMYPRGKGKQARLTFCKRQVRHKKTVLPPHFSSPHKFQPTPCTCVPHSLSRTPSPSTSLLPMNYFHTIDAFLTSSGWSGLSLEQREVHQFTNWSQLEELTLNAIFEGPVSAIFSSRL